jgi:hypothetical protein
MFPPGVQHRVVEERDERGGLDLYLVPRDLCVTVARGHLTAVMARRWIEAVDPHFRHGKVFRTFHDWEQLGSYDTTARRLLTTWLLANAQNVRSADFLVSSKLVAMGVSAANLMTTMAGLPMVAHTERAPFEAAYDEACAV